MDNGKTFDSIPNDLFLEILSRLPAKSIGRYRCVSKLWASILCSQDFTDLFLSRSRARPRLLIGVREDGEWSFFSLPQNHYENSSHVIAAAATDFHTKCIFGCKCSYVSGLIYFHHLCNDKKHVIYNPLTGQYVILPQLRMDRVPRGFFGFDPIDKEFKVLLMHTGDHHILTLGAGELRWRKIQCPINHEPFWERICINGVLYYLALHSEGFYFVIVCFDVRSEKFKSVRAEFRFDQLINFKGKLCGICLDDYDDDYGGFSLKLRMWVLEDVEKQEWSKYVYTLRDESNVIKVNMNLSVSGMTAAGDIVLSMRYASKPFYVFFFNPERNTLQVQSVEIQGVGINRDLISYPVFVDYVEDLSVNNAMQLKSSPLKQGRNIVTERPKPKQRRNTSRDLSKSSQSVKNKYELLLANMLYHSLGLAILIVFLFYFIIIFFIIAQLDKLRLTLW